MSEDYLKAIEVKNKLSGGASMDEFFPSECPWCESQCDYVGSDFDADLYNEYAACRSCEKRWVVVYKRSHYE